MKLHCVIISITILRAAAWSQPPPVVPANPDVADRITATDILLINFVDVPEGNHVNIDPGMNRAGGNPRPFYAPRGETRFVTDRGVDMGLPYLGERPDIGAIEFGSDLRLEGIPHPRL